jgi:hypothetical protein
LNPTLLNSHGITIAQVQAMLSQQNVHEAVGQIADGDRTLDIITNDQMHQADEYKPLVVGYHNGQAVHLSDVADVSNGAQNIRTAGYLDGVPFDHGDDLPPARRQHHRDQRPHQGGAALGTGLNPARHQTSPSFWIAPRPSAPRSTTWSGR